MDKIFTADWFSDNIAIWKLLFGHLSKRDNVEALEIGCFEGRSSLWLLENILVGKNSTLTVIDTFEGRGAAEESQYEGSVELRFKNNIALYDAKVEILKGYSQAVLRKMERKFDFIHVDGSHLAPEVLEDAVLAFPLLKPGGYMVFDDYLWGDESEDVDYPKVAIDSFIKVNAQRLKVIHKNYQLVLQKA